MRPLPGLQRRNWRLLYRIHRITRHFNFDKEVGILVLETRPCPVGRRSGIAADAWEGIHFQPFFTFGQNRLFTESRGEGRDAFFRKIYYVPRLKMALSANLHAT
jgi:hypothetical protein